MLRVLLCVSVLATAVTVQAQDEPSESDIARARAQYRIGVELVTGENWAEAEAAFLRAYVLYPEPLIIFNLASVREQLGRLLESRASYQEFLVRAGTDHQAYQESARTELVSIEARIGRIEFRIAGSEPSDILMVDGEAVEFELPLEADPGPHVVSVQRGTAQVARTRVNLEPGGSVVAELAVVNPERVVVVEEGSDNGVLIAVLTSAGVLAVAGGVILAFVLTAEEDPFMGNVGVVPIGLRIP